MKLFIVVFEHEYGSNIWPIFAEEKPDVEKVKAGVKDMTEKEWGDFYNTLSIRGPFNLPKNLITSVAGALTESQYEKLKEIVEMAGAAHTGGTLFERGECWYCGSSWSPDCDEKEYHEKGCSRKEIQAALGIQEVSDQEEDV